MALSPRRWIDNEANPVSPTIEPTIGEMTASTTDFTSAPNATPITTRPSTSTTTAPAFRPGRWPGRSASRWGHGRAAPYGLAGSDAASTNVTGSPAGSAIPRIRSTAPGWANWAPPSPSTKYPRRHRPASSSAFRTVYAPANPPGTRSAATAPRVTIPWRSRSCSAAAWARRVASARRPGSRLHRPAAAGGPRHQPRQVPSLQGRRRDRRPLELPDRPARRVDVGPTGAPGPDALPRGQDPRQRLGRGGFDLPPVGRQRARLQPAQDLRVDPLV